MQTISENTAIQTVFEQYSDTVQEKLRALHVLILAVASDNPAIGDLEETLKWGQISYRPKRRRVGTTIRIDQYKDDEHYALYVPCSTTLLDSYRSMFGDMLTYEGDRAILLPLDQPLPEKILRHCIELALMYHLKK